MPAGDPRFPGWVQSVTQTYGNAAMTARARSIVQNGLDRTAVLGDSHAAQDAFQATFLVLARKASIIDSESPLAAWLYKVAYRIALRARARTATRLAREEPASLFQRESATSLAQ